MYATKKKGKSSKKETPPAWGEQGENEQENENDQADEYEKTGSAYDKVNEMMGNYISSGKDALKAQQAVGKASKKEQFLANMKKGREAAKSAHASQKPMGINREKVPSKATKAA